MKKTFKIKRIWFGHTDGTDNFTHIDLEGGHTIVMDKVFISETFRYNIIWNTYEVDFGNFYIRVELRKPKEYSFHKGAKLEKEKERARLIANNIVSFFNIPLTAKPQP